MMIFFAHPEIMAKLDKATSITADKEFRKLRNSAVRKFLDKKGNIIITILEGASAYYVFYLTEKDVVDDSIEFSKIKVSVFFKKTLKKKAIESRTRYMKKTIELNELIDSI